MSGQILMCGAAPRVNPFSTRFIRPGAIPFIFPAGASAEQLVARLANSRWRGAVVGPHGSGKSTLLATLRPLLIAAGRRLLEATLREGERRLPAAMQPAGQWSESTLVIVDGYEQLSLYDRWRLRRRFLRLNCGLLVTCHRNTSLATLYDTRANSIERIVGELVRRLQTDADARVTDDDLASAAVRFGGNIREALFHFYDLYHQRG